MQETLRVWRSWVVPPWYDGPLDEPRSNAACWRSGSWPTAARARSPLPAPRPCPKTSAGERNYDYRFGWVRDLCFTLDALLAVGVEELTQAAVTWLLEATGCTHPRIDPVYALAGDVVRSQH